jgi:hypothetical protein
MIFQKDVKVTSRVFKVLGLIMINAVPNKIFIHVDLLPVTGTS